MNIRYIGKTLYRVLLIEIVFMLPSLIITLLDGEGDVAWAFIKSILLTLAVSGILWVLCRKAGREFYAQEGMVSVGLAWIIMSFFGCLPFYISGQIPSLVDSYFEIVSGFTTTGATILTDVEALSRGLIFWRSFSHWLGGMGVLVFLLALVPGEKNSGHTIHLLRAESPGPSVGKMTPKMRETAKVLYLIYIALTILCIFFLLIGGMPLFDSLCHAFGTAGTGGFGIKNDSVASYSPYLQNVMTVFMLVFGVNFTVFYLLILKEFAAALLDEELHLYLGVFFTSTALISWNILPLFGGKLGDAIHHAAFQVSTLMSSTGFTSTNFDAWPAFSKAILLVVMLMGACAGSTGGGLKMARVLILFKELRRNMRKLLHPRDVRLVRVNKSPVDELVVRNTSAYLTVYMLILFISFVLVSLDGFNVETNFASVVSCFNNMGPGMAMTASSFSIYSPVSKIILSFDMLLGRLEIFPILVIFSPASWKRNV